MNYNFIKYILYLHSIDDFIFLISLKSHNNKTQMIYVFIIY